MAKTGEIIALLFLDASCALTCPGCGQIGPMPSASDDAAAARRRSTGFYLFADINGGARVACCRCQQIQPDASVMARSANYDRVVAGPQDHSVGLRPNRAPPPA
jgi:hypothetical protein